MKPIAKAILVILLAFTSSCLSPRSTVKPSPQGLESSKWSGRIAIRTHVDPSPDGLSIVYHAQRPVFDQAGTAVISETGQRSIKTGLYISDIYGLNERVLVEEDERHAQEPRWSPDGNWIAFVGGTGYGPGENSLYIIRPNGTDRQVVAQSELGLIKAPTWSADSKFLAFNIRNEDPRVSEIHVLDLETRSTENITERFSGYHDHPRWSPDGESILISWEDAERKTGGLYSISPDGSGKQFWIIPPSRGQERMAAWSMHQDMVFFVRFGVEENEGEIIARDILSGVEVNATETPNRFDWFPVVSADGQYLVYSDSYFDEEGIWVYGNMVRRPLKEIRASLDAKND